MDNLTDRPPPRSIGFIELFFGKPSDGTCHQLGCCFDPIDRLVSMRLSSFAVPIESPDWISQILHLHTSYVQVFSRTHYLILNHWLDSTADRERDVSLRLDRSTMPKCLLGLRRLQSLVDLTLKCWEGLRAAQECDAHDAVGLLGICVSQNE